MDAELSAQFQTRTQHIDQAMRRDLLDIHSPLLHQVIEYTIFNGGKRLRPLLNILFAEACRASLPEPRRIYQFSLCFEYLHAASLLHDDVIDHAGRRRGRPSANVQWGNHGVILAGDFLHSRALFLAGTQGGLECLERVCRAVQGMVDGEYLQLENEPGQHLSEAYYFQVLRGKTAMLIRAACETGCLIAAASAAQCAAAQNFGENLGLAFQIIDDLLDYLGDTRKTGKETGSDWREQRMTLPLIYALANANEADKQWLQRQFKADKAERLKTLPEATQVLRRNGAFEQAQGKAQQLIDSAVAALALFPDCEATRLLRALAQYVVQREK